MSKGTRVIVRVALVGALAGVIAALANHLITEAVKNNVTKA